MSPLLMVLYGVFGMFVGSLSGLLGIGGGVLIVPGLVLLFGLTQQLAQGTSIALMVPPVYIFAAWTYYKAGRVDLKIAALLFVGFLAGGYAGALVATALPETLMTRLFGLLLAVLSVCTLLLKKKSGGCESDAQIRCTLLSSLALMAFGMLIGFLSGLFGVGGGALLVPGLVLWFGFGQKEAQGTTLAMMVLPTGMLAGWQYYQHDNINFAVAACICAGMLAGGFLGARFAASISSRLLTLIFVASTLAIATGMMIVG